MAAAIAASGTSQTPLGSSQRVSALSRTSAAASTSQRSCSTNDIVREIDRIRPQRMRTVSTGSGGRSNNNNSINLIGRRGGGKPTGTAPIVINNHHHLHLHCRCPSSEESGRGTTEESSTNTVDACCSPISEITIVNEVEPLLSHSLPNNAILGDENDTRS